MSVIRVNQLAASNHLGSVLGPRLTPAHGQVASVRLATDMVRSGRVFSRYADDLRSTADVDPRYLRIIKKAFLATREGYSADRVIADPHLNREFLEACARLGLDDSAYQINKSLFRLRKSSRLNLPRASKRTELADVWIVAPASEIAARTMFFRTGLSVDSLLCHPRLAKEFDQLARSLVPNHPPLHYRWAALNVRKRGSSGDPERLRAQRFEWPMALAFNEEAGSALGQPGLFALSEGAEFAYIGESSNIRDSLAIAGGLFSDRFLQASLWSPEIASLRWKVAPLPDEGATARAGVVNGLIGLTAPLFNIPRGRTAA